MLEALDRQARHLGVTRQSVIKMWLAERQFGLVEPVARDEGLRRTVGWERVHPPSEFQPEQFDYIAEDVTLALLQPQRGLG